MTPQQQKQQQQLGRGSYSSVVRSSTRHPGKVIKRLHPNASASSSTSFKHQKQLLDRIHHKYPDKAHLFNKIYQVTDRNQSVMEDLGNKNLSWYIPEKRNHAQNQQRNLLINDIDHVVEQLLDAFITMFKTGIVHRDIKPENIMAQYDPITRRINLTFIDFNHALMKSTLKTDTRFRIFGSLAYMSPELILRKLQKNKKKQDMFEYIYNDLWSLGIVMYELLYGKRPYQVYHDNKNKNYPTFNSTYEGYNQFYNFLKHHRDVYNNLFPNFKSTDPRAGYINDVKTLLSMDPKGRMNLKKFRNYFQGLARANLLLKASTQIEQHQKKRQREGVSLLLRATENMRKRKSTQSGLGQGPSTKQRQTKRTSKII